MASPSLLLQAVADAGLSHWDAAPFLQKVTEIVPSVIYIFNQDTQSNEYSNRSIGQSLGYSSAELLDMGAALMPMLCHPDDLPRVAAHFERIGKLKDGEVAQIEYRMRHKTGNWTWFLSNDTVFDRDLSGQVLRHIGVASDITAQKNAESRALEEKIKAKITNEELRAFSYAMSHDMKAPSNTLSMLLNELVETQQDQLSADAGELIDMAQATVKRLGTLVEDVMQYTSVITDEFSPKAVDLNTLAYSVLQDLALPIKEKAAHVEISDLPVVAGNQEELHILLKHLVQNAIIYHKPGETPKVRVTASPTNDGKWCNITVQDDGIGIDKSKHEQIFTIFKRLHGTVETSGSGLGLAICRRVAVNHKSKIELASSEGNGAAFTVRLLRA
ncbi:MAG: ATP-binding protein [Sulfitobacter sp.]